MPFILAGLLNLYGNLGYGGWFDIMIALAPLNSMLKLSRKWKDKNICPTLFINYVHISFFILIPLQYGNSFQIVLTFLIFPI
jgi:hypothetical protein